MRVLAIQNCEVEGFGVYEAVARERGVEWDSLDAWRNRAWPRPEGWDAVIIGGTPLAAYDADDHPFLQAELAFLEALVAVDIPCLGICCGAQLLARVLGAAVRPHTAKEIGMYEVALTDTGRVDPILAGFPNRFPVFQWHGDTLDVPSGGVLLVEGDRCRNQCFRVGNVVGVQFHLEVTARDVDRWSDAYADELAAFGATRPALVAEVRREEPETSGLARVLFENFRRQVRRRSEAAHL